MKTPVTHLTRQAPLWFTVHAGPGRAYSDHRIVADTVVGNNPVPDHSRLRHWEPDWREAEDRVGPAEPDSAEPDSPAAEAEHTEEIPDRHSAGTAMAPEPGPEPGTAAQAGTRDRHTAANTVGSDTPYPAQADADPHTATGQRQRHPATDDDPAFRASTTPPPTRCHQPPRRYPRHRRPATPTPAHRTTSQHPSRHRYPAARSCRQTCHQTCLQSHQRSPWRNTSCNPNHHPTCTARPSSTRPEGGLRIIILLPDTL